MNRRAWLGSLIGLSLASGCSIRGVSKSASPANRRDLPLEEVPPPDTRFYILVFGSQTTPKYPRKTHTWGTTVRVMGTGPTAQVEDFTISWMPATLEISPWHFAPEPGVNLNLHQSIELMLKEGEHVSLWGPYEITYRQFQRFHIHREFMESGQIGYQCIDTVGKGKDGSGSDCYHALTDMDPLFNRTRYPLTHYGEAASRRIVRELMDREVIIDPDIKYEWLLDSLDLRKYPLRLRDKPRLNLD